MKPPRVGSIDLKNKGHSFSVPGGRPLSTNVGVAELSRRYLSPSLMRGTMREYSARSPSTTLPYSSAGK